MSAVAQTPEIARSAARTRWEVVEVALAVAAFAVLCVLVLRATPYLPEPDDYAYQASIVAMTDGHFFTLSPPQAQALAEQLTSQLGGNPLGGGLVQWVQLPNGRHVQQVHQHRDAGLRGHRGARRVAAAGRAAAR